MIALRTYAAKHGVYEVEKLEVDPLRLLQISQDQLRALMERNVFLAEP